MVIIMSKKVSETTTENIFRNHYNEDGFIEKSAISDDYGFKSKKGTDYKGYPDFFRDKTNDDFCIVVEAKAEDHPTAEEEVKHYMLINKIIKTLLGLLFPDKKKMISKLHIS